jgi:hypothetical protein
VSDQNGPSDRVKKIVTTTTPQTHPVNRAGELRLQIHDPVARCHALKHEAPTFGPGVSVVPVSGRVHGA